jgi:hypothetical protein
MDLKNKKGIITVLVVVAVSLVAYKMLLKKDKRFFEKQIIDE